jgi:5'(3')-deoxyribonucleotidase
MPSDIGNVVLGVDLDGVCADFYARIRVIAAEWLEQPLESLPVEVSFGLREWGIQNSEQYLSLHRFAVTQRNLFGTSTMIPGARRYLRKLSDEGYRIRIITHRLFIHYFHGEAVRQTIDWLDNHGIPYWDLCFMKEKDQVGADIYVEDSPNNLRQLRGNGHYAICFSNSTNREIESPRAESWHDVYALVKAKCPNGSLASKDLRT